MKNTQVLEWAVNIDGRNLMVLTNEELDRQTRQFKEEQRINRLREKEITKSTRRNRASQRKLEKQKAKTLLRENGYMRPVILFEVKPADLSPPGCRCKDISATRGCVGCGRCSNLKPTIVYNARTGRQMRIDGRYGRW